MSKTKMEIGLVQKTKQIGELESFNPSNKEYPKIYELNIKDKDMYVPGKQTLSFEICVVKLGERLGSNNNDKQCLVKD